MLLVFVKPPRAGLVKTRLARDLGADAAAALYRALAERVREQTAPRDGEYARVFFFAPAEERREIEAWLPGETCVAQKGADLGERMAAAFAWAFARGTRPVVLIGTDAPDLTRAHVTEALAALAQNDVVLAPAQDGGYSLIGLGRPCPELFSDMNWSTPSVLADTLTRAQALGLLVATREPVFDIDTIEDLRDYWGRVQPMLPRALAQELAAKLGEN